MARAGGMGVAGAAESKPEVASTSLGHHSDGDGYSESERYRKARPVSPLMQTRIIFHPTCAVGVYTAKENAALQCRGYREII